MKPVLIAGLALAAVAASAHAAPAPEEDWRVVGGDGSALGYDKSSIRKEGPGQVSLRYGVYSATALPTPPGVTGKSMFGFSGLMTVNCQDKTAKGGETTYYFAYGGERTSPPPAKANFEKVRRGDYTAYFLDVACNGRKTLDTYEAKGRAEGIALLRTVSGLPHVTNTAAKGWTFALADGARLLAIDTSATKRTGQTVMQPEIAWMRKPQTTNGQSWRYYFLVTEYDCAKGRRRGAGSFRIYNDADQPVHEETIADAPWEPLSGPEATALLDMACKNKKLAGLPSGSRSNMLVRLRQLAAMP
jgi:hypothetical protein